MGLIEELSTKVFDEATAEHRATKQQREELRTAVVSLLRDYSAQIERMRIALQDLVAFLQRMPDLNGFDAALQSYRELAEIGDWQGEQQVWALIKALGPDQKALSRAHQEAVDAADELSRRSADARAASKEADQSWAALRPVLDDALEIEAVSYLRWHRHGMRHALEDVFWSMNGSQLSELTVERQQRYKRDTLDEQLHAALAWAEIWNRLLSDVRKHFLPKRKRRHQP